MLCRTHLQIINKIWNFVVVLHTIQYRNSANFSYTQWWPHWDKLRAFISCYSNDASNTKLATTMSRFFSWYSHEMHHFTMAVRPLLIGQYNMALLKNVRILSGACGQNFHMCFCFLNKTQCCVMCFGAIPYSWFVSSLWGHLTETMSMWSVTYELSGKFLLTALSSWGV
jgi:hypothetical protein